MSKDLIRLAEKLAHKYANEIDDLEEPIPATRPEGIARVQVPEDQEDRIKATFSKVLKPFINYVADNIVYEQGDNILVEVDLMTHPNNNYDTLPILSKSHFFHMLLELVQHLQKAFPDGRVTLENSNMSDKEVTIKMVRVTIPKK